MICSWEYSSKGLTVTTYTEAEWESECRWHLYCDEHGYHGSPGWRGYPPHPLRPSVDVFFSWDRLRDMLTQTSLFE